MERTSVLSFPFEKPPALTRQLRPHESVWLTETCGPRERDQNTLEHICSDSPEAQPLLTWHTWSFIWMLFTEEPQPEPGETILNEFNTEALRNPEETDLGPVAQRSWVRGAGFIIHLEKRLIWPPHFFYKANDSELLHHQLLKSCPAHIWKQTTSLPLPRVFN